MFVIAEMLLLLLLLPLPRPGCFVFSGAALQLKLGCPYSHTGVQSASLRLVCSHSQTPTRPPTLTTGCCARWAGARC